VEKQGGQIVQQSVKNLDELITEEGYDVVINCAGINGSKLAKVNF